MVPDGAMESTAAGMQKLLAAVEEKDLNRIVTIAEEIKGTGEGAMGSARTGNRYTPYEG